MLYQCMLLPGKTLQNEGNSMVFVLFFSTSIFPQLQSNLVNSKSSGLEDLFRMISSSNYREVDIKILNP